MLTRITKHLIPREALQGPANVPLPSDARVLSVSNDGVKPCLYVAGAGDAVEPRWFRLAWTLDAVPAGAVYLGTIKVLALEGGAEVWHCFELPHLRGQHEAGA